MGTDLDTPSQQESTPLTEHPFPAADNLLRRAAFLRRLAVLGRKNGFGVAHELTATGAVVWCGRIGTGLLHSEMVELDWTEMTEDKIKELIVRWTMGL